jgi:hypothetical protein
MVDHENLYLRGQVLEILLTITDCDRFDWFAPPESTADKILHQKYLQLGRSPLFLRKLMANRTGSYPGGSFRALQLIAFTLSWMRALYTADQKLQLSAQALQTLTLWCEQQEKMRAEQKRDSTSKTDIVTPENADSASNVKEEEEEEQDPELQLARTLLEDFSGKENSNTSPATPDEQTGACASSSSDLLVSHIDDSKLLNITTSTNTLAATAATTAVGAASPEGEQSPIPTKSTPAPHGPSLVVPPRPPTALEAALALKAQGNDLFKFGSYEDAVARYAQAIEACHKAAGEEVGAVSEVESPPELLVPLHCNIATAWEVGAVSEVESPPELLVSLHCNIATAWWKVISDCLLKYPELELLCAVEKAATDCKESSLGGASFDTDGQDDASYFAARATFTRAQQECTAASESALQLQAGCVKAAYRLASLLLLQNKPRQALRVVQAAAAAATATAATAHTAASTTGEQLSEAVSKKWWWRHGGGQCQ